jgi:hypothetical protein
MAVHLSTYSTETPYSFLESTKKVKIHDRILDKDIELIAKTNDLGKKFIASMVLGLFLGTVFSFNLVGSILLGLGISYLTTSDEMDHQIQSTQRQWSKIGDTWTYQ